MPSPSLLDSVEDRVKPRKSPSKSSLEGHSGVVPFGRLLRQVCRRLGWSPRGGGSQTSPKFSSRLQAKGTEVAAGVLVQVSLGAIRTPSRRFPRLKLSLLTLCVHLRSLIRLLGTHPCRLSRLELGLPALCVHPGRLICLLGSNSCGFSRLNLELTDECLSLPSRT